MNWKRLDVPYPKANHLKDGKLFGWNGNQYPRFYMHLHLTKEGDYSEREHSAPGEVYFSFWMQDEEGGPSRNASLPVELMKDCAEMLLGENKEPNSNLCIDDIMNDIESDGYSDGFNRRPSDNPHEERTPAWEAYEVGYGLGINDG